MNSSRHAPFRQWVGLLTAFVLGCSILVQPLAAGAAPAEQPPLPAGRKAPGQILVKFRTDLEPGWGGRLTGVPDAKPGRTIGRIKVHRFQVPTGKEEEFVERFRRNPLVDYAELDYQVSVALAASDPDTSARQWHLDKIDAPAAWDVTTGAESPVTIAILDTGIDGTHPDLQNRVGEGYDVVTRRTLPAGSNSDDYWHGTHIAGIAAANANNGIGGAGVSWSAELMPVKVLDSTGYGTYSDLSEGIIWASDHGARVINMSLGGAVGSEEETRTLRAAVDYAWDRGSLLVAAAGNEGASGNQANYPAALDKVIAVAATTSTDEHAVFSNYQSYVDLAAPGTGIWSTIPRGGYAGRSGTSMAVPIVSGVAALLLAANPSQTPSALTQHLVAATLDLGAPGPDSYFGAGRLSAGRALLAGAVQVDTTEVVLDRAGGPQAQALVTVSGRSLGRVRWQARSDADWLKVSGKQVQAGEVAAAVTDQIHISVDPSRVPAGAAAATIQVGALLGDDLVAPQTIHVQLGSSGQQQLFLPGLRRGAVVAGIPD